ncbi:Transcription elongation regulator 1 [Labeo rohita]|uniref:Transcription elongation regulator 1 n=1 Tax=Labeo rohita TaxID=84645 RepID=A0ABQ8LJP7_LABRO|nr:Transcription elongation regulator 1 [Labeo rohita]
MPVLLPPSSDLFVYPELSTGPGIPLSDVLPRLESPEAHKFPLTLSFLPPPPLSPGSPSAHPQPTICAVGSPPWLEDPLSPSPASESQTPPRPIDPAASQRLLAPSSPPWPISPPSSPGSPIPPALPWLVVNHPAPQDSTSLAPPCPSISPALSSSSLPSRPSGSLPPPRSPEPSAPSSHPGSSALRLCLRLLLHLLCCLRSAPWSRQPYLHYGSFLRRIHHWSRSWSQPGSHLAPPWLLPPSGPPWLQLFPPSVVSTLESAILLPGVRPPPVPPPKFLSVPPFVVPTVRGCAFREGGELLHPGLFVCVFLPCAQLVMFVCHCHSWCGLPLVLDYMKDCCSDPHLCIVPSNIVLT